jgi:hypothetical protein
MTTQTEEPVASREAETDWGSRRSSSARALRADFAALKPTLLGVGAVIAIGAIAVEVSLTVWSPASAGDRGLGDRLLHRDGTSLRAGQHTIAFTNKGKQGHELLLFRTDLPANALPVDATATSSRSPRCSTTWWTAGILKVGETQSLPVKL